MRHKYHVTILLLFIVVAFAYYAFKRINTETAVYKVVLEGLSGKIPIDKFSFYNHPSTCRGAKADSLSSIPKQVFASFVHNNNSISARPGSLKAFSKQYHIVSQDDSDRIFNDKKPLLENIPKPLINLSRVGFNADKTLALLCVESQESGDLVYLSRKTSFWKVHKWQYSW